MGLKFKVLLVESFYGTRPTNGGNGVSSQSAVKSII